MKRILLYVILTLSGIILNSCSSEKDVVESRSKVLVKFNTTTDINVTTQKAITANSAWKPNDNIGVFMLKHGTSEISLETTNKEYMADQAGDKSGFTPANESQKIYFPMEGARVDFVSYSPFQALITDFVYPIDIAQQIDLLYSKESNNSIGYDSKSGEIELKFIHAMSLLSMEVELDASLAGLTINKIEVQGIETKATFDLSSGSFNQRKSEGVLTPIFNGTAYDLIMLPQTFGSSGKVLFYMSNSKIYTWNLADISLEQSKKHIYSLVVSEKHVVLKTIDIDDWIVKEPIDGEGHFSPKYQVGDYYPYPDADLSKELNILEVEGIVYWIEPGSNNKRGKVLAIRNSSATVAWATDAGASIITGATDLNDGMVNTKQIQAIPSWKTLFPACNAFYLTSIGENWYIPAANEFELFKKSVIAFGVDAFDAKLLLARGDKIIDSDDQVDPLLNSYWSSTSSEALEVNPDVTHALLVHFYTAEPLSYPKVTTATRVRAIRNF